jgi:hypothetical protein
MIIKNAPAFFKEILDCMNLLFIRHFQCIKSGYDMVSMLNREA